MSLPIRRLLKSRAANHCPGDTTPARINLSVWTCSLLVWLLYAGQVGFTVHRACLEDGHMYWLSSASTAIYGKRALGRTVQQWRVVGFRLREGKTTMKGLCKGCSWWWTM